MKKDTELWLEYAEENIKSSEVLLNSSLFNPCLQNVQQAVEKYPLSSVLPHFMPDEDICRHCLKIAHQVRIDVYANLAVPGSQPI